MVRISSALIALSLISIHAFADSSDKPSVTFNGFVDAYYSYNFNNPQPTTAANASTPSGVVLPPATNNYRYYDSYHNQMTLSLVEFSVLAKYQEVSFLGDFDFGTFADLNGTISSAAGNSSDEVSKHIGQAVISYQPQGSRWFFDAGKMYSHLGVETVKSKDNFNYSRTILFSYAIPFWHTGVRVGYDVVPEKFQTSLYVYNGWNSIYDTNESKTVGAQLKYTPTSTLAVVYNFLAGPEGVRDESNWRFVHELNATFSVWPTLSLISDLIYVNEDKAQWYGGLVGAKYILNEKSYISPRYEIYRDDDGFSLGKGAQTIQSGTFTYGRTFTKGLEYRAEARFDKSNEKTFTAHSSNKDSQTTLLAALLLNF